MKAKYFLSMLLLLCTSLSFSQTQTEMNGAVSGTLVKADKELNDTYNEILRQYKSDASFIKNLKKSQKLWIKFRDAEMKVKYPKREAGFYGSMQPLCYTNYMAELTRKRTKELKDWLKGAEEGDTCAGSIKKI